MQDAADEPRGIDELVLPEEGGILPLFGTVIYPQTVTPLAISQPEAVRLVDEALKADGMLTLVALRAERVRPPAIGPEQCYDVGTVALIHRLLRLPDNTLRVAAEGIERVRIAEISATEPYLRGRFVPLLDRASDRGEAQPLLTRAIEQMRALSRFLPVLTDDLQLALANEESPQRLSYLLAMSVAAHTSVAERQALLQLDSVVARLNQLIVLIDGELERALGRLADAPGGRTLGGAALERRPELRDLPLVQEALEAGRLEGIRSLLIALLRDRFPDDPRLPAVEETVTRVHDQHTLQRLALLAARAADLQELAEVL